MYVSNSNYPPVDYSGKDMKKVHFQFIYGQLGIYVWFS